MSNRDSKSQERVQNAMLEHLETKLEEIELLFDEIERHLNQADIIISKLEKGEKVRRNDDLKGFFDNIELRIQFFEDRVREYIPVGVENGTVEPKENQLAILSKFHRMAGLKGDKLPKLKERFEKLP